MASTSRPRTASRRVAASVALAATVGCLAPVAPAVAQDSGTNPRNSSTDRDTGTNGRRPAYNGRPRVNVPIAYARVVLDEQMTYVYNARRRLVATVPSSTGLDGSTPTGTFRVFSKSAASFYTPNPEERMRWMVRFTKGRQGGNIGFHGIPFRVIDGVEVPFRTPLGEEPSSHGCIRLAVQDARWIFDNMPIGAVVTVVRSRGD